MSAATNHLHIHFPYSTAEKVTITTLRLTFKVVLPNQPSYHHFLPQKSLLHKGYYRLLRFRVLLRILHLYSRFIAFTGALMTLGATIYVDLQVL
jgi:hypothetical protein